MAYGRRILLGVARYIRERGPWSVYLETRSLYDPAPRWLSGWDGDGIICRVGTAAAARAICDTGIPTVNLSASIPAIVDILGEPPVLNDQRAIGHLGAEHLLERGLKCFGYFGFPGFRWSDGRFEGFRDVIEGQGLGCTQFRGLGKTTHRYRVQSWEKEIDAVARWVAEMPKPVGLLASHDFRAVQLLDACRRADVAVPEEVAVVGVDDEDICCDLAHPPLSSILPDHERIGIEAAALLDRLMGGGSAAMEPMSIPPLGVIARQSTDMTAIDDPVMAKALRFICEGACNGINVNDVLRHVIVARSTLQLRFRKWLGKSVHQVIFETRLRRVKQLLAETKLPLGEIARLAGLQYVEHLCVAFKQHTGQTPNEYRQSLGDAAPNQDL